MKLLLLMLTFNISLCFGQTKTESNKIWKHNELEINLDSLKNKILADTVRFNRKDLYHWNIGTSNKKPYSPLFVIEKYQYKLDIIEGKLVVDFVNEILQFEKIESITILPKQNSISLFGVNGELGVVWIKPKKNAKFNFKIAGLNKKNKRKLYDNFDQREKNEVRILY